MPRSVILDFKSVALPSNFSKIIGEEVKIHQKDFRSKRELGHGN